VKLGAMNNPGKEVVAQLEFIAAAGFDFVELAVEAPEASPEVLRQREKRIGEILESHSLEVVAHLPWYFEIAHPYARVREAFLQEVRSALEVASDLGAKLAGLHLHRLPKFFRDKMLELHLSALREVLEHAEALGLVLGVENSDLRSFPPEKLEALLEALPGLKLVLDIAHAHIGASEEEVLAFVRSFSPRVVHVHAHDNNLKDDLHLPIGAGAIEWERLLPELKRFYDGGITLEVHSRDPEYLLLSRRKFLELWRGEGSF